MIPLVSVFLIAYNEENYIEEALNSILRQKTDFDFEILCHDDASTDRTPQIIQKYAKEYPEVVIPLLQTENQIKKNINIVIEYLYPKARGKYIAYCDGDDYWTDERKLQKQVDFLESHRDYSMCTHQFTFLYEASGERKLSLCGRGEKDFVIEDFINWDAKYVPQLGTAMFIKNLAVNRPALFQKIGGGRNSLRLISDVPLYIFLSLQGRVKYIPENMSVWRRRVTGTLDAEYQQDVNKSINRDKQYIHFLRELDEYTNYKFRECIVRKINTISVDIAYRSLEFRSCKNVIWKSNQLFKKKVFMSFACFFPKLAKIIIKQRKK